jgi:hypothetical protein
MQIQCLGIPLFITFILMKLKASLIILLFAGCHSAGNNDTASTPAKEMSSQDTSKAGTTVKEADPNNKAIVHKTHLRDTLSLSGNFMLFLRPNDERFKELNANEEEGGGDADADFGVGIANTQDTISKNSKYTGIKVKTTDKRYISINDCEHCPLVIDRDSVDYGYILSGKGKKIATTYNSVHSGDYMGEINDYFFSKQ